MASGKGIFIVLYGPSGVGKTKQLELLGEKLTHERIQHKRILYPMLDFGESGKKLKKILWRKERNLPEEEMQKLFTENRMEFEPTLNSWLNSGITVLAEDYVGTGIIWGLT